MSKQRKCSNEYIRERAVSWCTIHRMQKKKNKKWKMLDYFFKNGVILLLKKKLISFKRYLFQTLKVTYGSDWKKKWKCYSLAPFFCTILNLLGTEMLEIQYSQMWDIVSWLWLFIWSIIHFIIAISYVRILWISYLLHW